MAQVRRGDPFAVAEALFRPLQIDIERIRRAAPRPFRREPRERRETVIELLARHEKLEKAWELARKK